MAIALHQPPTRLYRPSRARHLRLVAPVDPVDPTPVAPARPRAASRATYVRRRMFVGLAVVMVIMGAVFVSRALASSEPLASVVSERYVIAQEGDNLWSIAERINPSGNIPQIVDQLAALNGTSLRVGQVVLIP